MNGYLKGLVGEYLFESYGGMTAQEIEAGDFQREWEIMNRLLKWDAARTSIFVPEMMGNPTPQGPWKSQPGPEGVFSLRDVIDWGAYHQKPDQKP